MGHLLGHVWLMMHIWCNNELKTAATILPGKLTAAQQANKIQVFYTEPKERITYIHPLPRTEINYKFTSVTRLMVLRPTITVCLHKHSIWSKCRVFSVKLRGMYSYHCALTMCGSWRSTHRFMVTGAQLSCLQLHMNCQVWPWNISDIKRVVRWWLPDPDSYTDNT